MTVTTIQPEQVDAKINAGESVTLIDVRTPLEFSEVHAKSAKNVPLARLDVKAVAQQHTSAAPIYVICKSGKRAAKACDAFVSAGIGNVVNVEGGTDAWVAAGLPVERSGRKVISLERQVRIVAGLIVLTGAILAITVHPWFVGLCAFVGAGLTFAGITDFCGMGMLLAKAPWNRCDGGGKGCK